MSVSEHLIDKRAGIWIWNVDNESYKHLSTNIEWKGLAICVCMCAHIYTYLYII